MLLTDNKIQYKWLFPEGLNFQREGKPVRLDPVYKDKRFANENAQKLGYQTSSEELASEVETQPDGTQPHISQQGAVGGTSKPWNLWNQELILKNQ